MRAATTNRGSRRWRSTGHPLITVTLRRCTPPAVVPPPTDIQVSCCISRCPSLPPRTVAMDILPTAMILTSPHPARSVPRRRRLRPSRAATPPGRRPTPIIPLNALLPTVSATQPGLHDLILRRSPIETAGVTTEIGIVNAVADIYRSTLLPPTKSLLPALTPPPIPVIALVLVLLATTVPLNHPQGTHTSRFQAGLTLPRGPTPNLLRLVPPLNLSLNLTHRGGMIPGTTAGILEN